MRDGGNVGDDYATSFIDAPCAQLEGGSEFKKNKNMTGKNLWACTI